MRKWNPEEEAGVGPNTGAEGGPAESAKEDAGKMTEKEQYSSEVTIENKLGFHVRPIQRFAELARAFNCDVEVEIEDRSASGKSVLELMSLTGKEGSRMKITCRGGDARQCHCILVFLASNRFFVENQLNTDQHPHRHLRRLAKMSSCFDSRIEVVANPDNVDATDFSALKELGITPETELELDIEGKDAEQARAVMENLLKYRFYVETSCNLQESE